jgi:hypothetical protein
MIEAANHVTEKSSGIVRQLLISTYGKRNRPPKELSTAGANEGKAPGNVIRYPVLGP